jgi:hypothetical protein
VDDQSPGPPRCYFCGKRFPESDARKTEYAVGPGQRIMVLICPACHRQKLHGEGPFATSGAAVLAVVLPFVLFLGFVLFIIFGVIRPGMREHEEFREKVRKDHNEFRQQHGFGP